MLCRHTDADCRPFFPDAVAWPKNATALGLVAVKEQAAGIQIKLRR